MLKLDFIGFWRPKQLYKMLHSLVYSSDISLQKGQ